LSAFYFINLLLYLSQDVHTNHVTAVHFPASRPDTLITGCVDQLSCVINLAEPDDDEAIVSSAFSLQISHRFFFTFNFWLFLKFVHTKPAAKPFPWLGGDYV
jgi:hypothetical protein